jgi:hypothetical protein
MLKRMKGAKKNTLVEWRDVQHVHKKHPQVQRKTRKYAILPTLRRRGTKKEEPCWVNDEKGHWAHCPQRKGKKGRAGHNFNSVNMIIGNTEERTLEYGAYWSLGVSAQRMAG